MLPFYTHFRHTVRWITIESLTYYGLLSLHQLVLFRFTTPELYGVIGTTYALSYLCVYFLILGFDKALAPFFARFSQNKASITSLIWYQALPTYIFTGCILGLLYSAKPYLAPKFHYLDFISNPLFLVLIAKVFIEITRKGFKSLLILTHQTHIAAAAEIIAMLLYIVVVWSLFILTGSITLAKIFIPLVTAISISTIIMIWFVFKWFRSLPTTNGQVGYEVHKQFAQNRIATTGFQLSRLFFSSEFLIPFFAYKFGLSQAGLLKLASKIVSTFSTIIRRVFETSSNVLMAHVRECSLENRTGMFSLVTNWINQALYACIIFFIINHNYLFQKNSIATTELSFVPLAYGYLFLILMNSIFIAYEQFYIAQERAYYLFILNFATIGAFLISLSIFPTISSTSIIVLLAVIRLVSCALLGLYSYLRWHIKPSIAARPFPLIGATAISLLFFILYR